MSRPAASRHPPVISRIRNSPFVRTARSVDAWWPNGPPAPPLHACARIRSQSSVQYPTSNVRVHARALDDILNPDGSWARRTVYHSFRLLHPYQWSHRSPPYPHSCDIADPVVIVFTRSLGRWAYSSASTAAFKVLDFVARTLRIRAPASATKSAASDHA